MRDDWDSKAAWMRTVGATDAAWSTEGHLVHVKLGPAPTEEPQVESTESPTARLLRERRERRELASRASGGPIRRLSEDD